MGPTPALGTTSTDLFPDGQLQPQLLAPCQPWKGEDASHLHNQQTWQLCSLSQPTFARYHPANVAVPSSEMRGWCLSSPKKTPLTSRTEQPPAVTVTTRSKARVSSSGGRLAPGPSLVAADSCSSVKCSLWSSVFSILLFVFFPPACLSADSHATHGIINKSAAA